MNLPPGLKDGSKLPKTIFTPATKAALGDHDENVTFDEVVAAIGQDEAQTLRRLTVLVYERAASIAADRGLILADTKFEFGIRADGTIVLADEVLTPDSSRYWPEETWEPGHAQPSYDKQYVRDWLTSPASGWDRSSGEAPPAAARRGRREDPREVRRGLRAPHRQALRLPKQPTARLSSAGDPKSTCGCRVFER